MINRRRFLETAIGSVAALSLGAPEAFAAAADFRAGGSRVLSVAEARFTVAMVDALCPADRSTPGGTDCGLADFIEWKLGTVYGDERVGPGDWTRRSYYKAGIAAVDEMTVDRFGVPFRSLDPAAAAIVLRESAAGRAVGGFDTAGWTSKVLNPLLVRASFSEPTYSAYSNRVFWKLFG